jgi:hypothetical protein
MAMALSAQLPIDDHPRDASILDAALRRRAELYDSTKALVRALESASPGRETNWLHRVHDALQTLRTDFIDHVATTEAPDGVHAEMLHVQPRLANRVRRLCDDHAIISDRIEAVVALSSRGAAEGDRTLVMTVRDEATQLVALITRHRQRSADLVYEAYNTDIGIGE